MVVLPLGLKARTVDVAIVSIALVLVTAFYSVLHIDIAENFESNLIQSKEMKAHLQSRFDLVIEACGKKFSPEICQRLKRRTEPVNFLDSTVIAQRINAEFTEMDLKKNILEFVNSGESWDLEKSPYQALASYQAYRDSSLQMKQATLDIEKNMGLVSQSSFSWSRIFRAQFLHAGWMHLIGNLVFFILIAGPVEQRLGGARFILTYFVGGLAGLYLHVLLSKNPESFIIGASANIFAIAGAFAVLFWNKKAKVWASFFGLISKVVFVPTLVFFGGWIILGEISGAIQAQSGSRGGGVAHLAHLGGALIGAAIAFASDKMRQKPMSAGMIYPYEIDLQAVVDKKADHDKKLKLLNHWLELNPDNTEAFMQASRAAFFLLSLQTPSRHLKKFLEKNMTRGFSDMLEQKNLKFFASIPLQVNLGQYIKQADPQKLILLANLHLKKQQLWPAIHLMDLFLQLHPSSKRSESVMTTIQEVWVEYSEKLQQDGDIEAYLNSHHNSVLADLQINANVKSA